MSKETTPRYIPLIETVREIDTMSQVWLEGHGGVILPVKEGDVVTIQGRVYEVRRAGGYMRGVEERVKRRDAFTLDLGEIFLDLGIGL